MNPTLSGLETDTTLGSSVMKKKRLTGTDTGDLFLEKMADHCVKCGLLMVRNGNGDKCANWGGTSGRS